jgi:pimeloyl-ACP methyl ester carboxylesterase
MKPTRSGYADVNGIRLYHEIYIYGEGEPLVLIHGGLTTIDQIRNCRSRGSRSSPDTATTTS